MYGWAQAQLFDAMAANAFGHQSSYDHGVFSADALAKQCKAVNLIQRCWRRARERRLSLNIALDVTVQYRDSDGFLSEADKRNAANDVAHMPYVVTWLIRRPPSCGVRSDQVGQETDSESEHSISDEALSGLSFLSVRDGVSLRDPDPLARPEEVGWQFRRESLEPSLAAFRDAIEQATLRT